MTSKSNPPITVDHALLRAEPHLGAGEIQAINNIVPGLAERYVDNYFEDRSAIRIRKNRLTAGIVFLCFAIGFSLLIGASFGQPVAAVLTGLTALSSAVGHVFLYLTNRK